MTTDTRCPLCGYEARERRAVYSHLMTNHRKSTLSRELMEADGLRPE